MAEPTLYPPDTCPFMEQAVEDLTAMIGKFDAATEKLPPSIVAALDAATPGWARDWQDAWCDARVVELMAEAREARMEAQEP